MSTENRGGNQEQGRPRRPRVADYSHWLLFWLLATVTTMILIAVPLTQFFMANYEERPVTLGQSAVFVVQSLTTVGYGELLPFESTHMKVLAIFLMLSGVTLVFMIGGTIVATLVERRVTRRAPTETDARDHVIFTGFSEGVGRTIDLLEDHGIPYVIAASREQLALELLDEGYYTIFADPERDEGLARLGVDRARLVVASSGDAANVNVTLGALEMAEIPVLALMSSQKTARVASDAGAARAVSPHETLGRELVDWIVADPSPTEFLRFLDVDLTPEVLEQLTPSIFHVSAGHPLAEETLGSSRLRSRTGATVVALWRRDGVIANPEVDERIGDATMIVLGTAEGVERLADHIGGPGAGEHVVLAGAGEVGQKAGQELNRVGIEPDVIDIHQRRLTFKGRLIVGDATDRATLRQAGISRASTFIAAMDSDSLNIFATLEARQLNPNLNVVARAGRAETMYRLRRAGADHVLSESIVTSQILHLALVELGVVPKPVEYVIREVPVPVSGLTIQEMAERYDGGLRFIAVIRGEQVLAPDAGFMLESSDQLVVLGMPAQVVGMERRAAVAAGD